MYVSTQTAQIRQREFCVNLLNLRHLRLKIAAKKMNKIRINLCAKSRYLTRRMACAALLAVCCALPAHAQELSGYVNRMFSLVSQQPADETWWQSQVHNRLSFGWQFSEHWRVDAGMRNRFMLGSEAMIQPESTAFDAGLADLSWNWVAGKKVLGNTLIDRLSVTFERDKWQLRLGRQRINWGQTLVWNPNDIFNTYSFFDFDYPERSGCDAFRATYYHSETASSELAASVNRDGKLTAALLHHWSRKNFDFQLMAGEQAQADLVLGGACTGDFGGLCWRSEAAIFRPVRNFSDTTTVVAASVGVDYTFGSSLTLQAEALYNNVGNAFSGSGLMGLYAAPLSAKFLSICDWSIFAQASYPFTPRLNAALSGMYFADAKACYTGATVDCSITENLDLSLIAQYFSTVGSAAPDEMQVILGFVRLKYSF